MESGVLETSSLDSRSGLIVADFPRGDFAAISRLDSLLVRAGCFFPGGSAVAAVVVPESSVRFGSWEDAGADTSANRTGMAHYYCLTVGILVSERLGFIA